MGDYGELQRRYRELDAERRAEERERYSGTASGVNRRGGIGRNTREEKLFRVARHIAGTLTSRGDMGNFTVSTQHRVWFGREKLTPLFRGWVLHSWNMGPSYEGGRIALGSNEMQSVQGVALSNTGGLASITTTETAGSGLPGNIVIAVSGGRSMDYSHTIRLTEDSATYNQAITAVGSQTVEQYLTRFATDKYVSLADF